MLVVSKEYKAQMNQRVRAESYVWVYLGVISREAQQNAAVSNTLYDLASGDIFGGESVEGYYSTFEENQCHVDGTMTLAPEKITNNPLFQGAISADLFGSITFTFGEYKSLNWRGLTFNFGEFYPTKFAVTNGHETYTHENDSAQCVIEDIFTNTDHITVTPITMAGGSQRLRILSISFGVGLVFDNKSLISTSRKNIVNHLSGSLPSKQFTWTVDNRSHRFHVDDPSSYINFLEQEQDVEYEYGRKLYDSDGNPYVYRLAGGKVRLKTWSSNQTQAKFTAVGLLDYLTTSYYRGQYYPNGVTAYNLALAVLADAGIEDYRIDSYLKQVTIHNPLPNDRHKNCLQLIANLSRSILYEDRQGRVVIESSFVPEITSVSGTGQTEWSCVGNVILDKSLINYATFEMDYSAVDDTMYLLPDNTGVQQNNGYVSSYLFPRINGDDQNKRFAGRLGSEYFPFRSSKEVGVWEGASAAVTVEWEAQWTFYRIDLTFGAVYPRKVRIHKFADGEETGYTDFEITGLENYLEDEYFEVDKIVIEFIEANAHQRIYLNKAVFGNLTDYELTFRDMADKPTVTALEKVKTIDVHYYQYTYGTEVKKVATTYLQKGDNLLTYNKAYHGWSAAYTKVEETVNGAKVDKTPTGTLTIKESGAYYVIVNSSISANVDISAYEFSIADSTLGYANKEIGEVKTSKNDLIDNLAEATRQGEWLGEYYSYDSEYSISYRGEPRLDCDDLIFVTSDFTDDNLIRITEEQLDTSTGMSMKCKIKGRRTGYTLRK